MLAPHLHFPEQASGKWPVQLLMVSCTALHCSTMHCSWSSPVSFQRQCSFCSILVFQVLAKPGHKHVFTVGLSLLVEDSASERYWWLFKHRGLHSHWSASRWKCVYIHHLLLYRMNSVISNHWRRQSQLAHVQWSSSRSVHTTPSAGREGTVNFRWDLDAHSWKSNVRRRHLSTAWKSIWLQHGLFEVMGAHGQDFKY